MYIPEFNRVEDRTRIVEFMRASPFAILVSPANSVPFATHLPAVVTVQGADVTIRGHLAKANQHWKLLSQETDSLLIFHGPHAYISPALYESRESVPTWNYAAVHVYGRTRTLDEDGAKRVLDELIAQFDPSYAAQWQSLAGEYRSRMLRQIVAFELVASRIEAKFKLSQNRTRGEQQSVIDSLSHSEDTNAAAVAGLMRRQGLGLP